MDSSSEASYASNLLGETSGTAGTHRPLVRHRSVRENIEDGFVLLEKPENEIEEKKLEHNYMFGFKKWKAHVTQRPFEERSEAVKSLYQTTLDTFPALQRTVSVGNVFYCLMIGWWVAIAYLFIAALMAVTIIGWPYAKFCCKLSFYFLWPFGKFVKEYTNYELQHAVTSNDESEGNRDAVSMDADQPNEQGTPTLVGNSDLDHEDAVNSSSWSPRSEPRYLKKVSNVKIWRRPSTYVWILLGAPALFFIHSIVIVLCGLLVIFIPVSKLYLISLKKVFLMPPEKMCIGKHFSNQKRNKVPMEVILCVYKAVNIYFYKYTVDGMNIMVTNMLVIVLITLGFGYGDPQSRFISPVTKFIFGVISIIPCAHYLGFAITSISSQSRHVVGAFINALFGSIIEIFLYVSTLLKQKEDSTSPCYPEIVKSALTGSLLATMLFIPGICMVVGGIKHKEQAVNVRSASVSSTLLFISVAGAFTPTIFATSYGGYTCANCNITASDSTKSAFQCKHCRYTVKMPDGTDFYHDNVQPIVISVAVLLPVAYVIGLFYSLFTHAQVLDDHFKEKQSLGNVTTSQGSGHHPQPVVLWGRLKSVVILLVFTVAMAFSAEVAINSLEDIIKGSRITETFIGVTVIAVVPEIPEIINGIQFALKNNINLSLEIGSSIAVQVCLLQIPVLVVIDWIYPLSFSLLFNDIHLWSVILSVIIMNYTFVDGKSDYFQGSMLCIVYLILLIVFFFAPETAVCRM